ncbi:MAG: nucleotidyl transferase AbiEii/AbiGii toxin family protein [Acidobacteriota bacterium]|nr:nucleotidyl transferase AbiEii/AbiGii toxin family protein [Acidobacteriota bacterium]
MTDTLLRWRRKIPDFQLDILHSVFGACVELNIPAFVVGATARDLIFEYVYEADIQRATEDIDFGVAVGSWADYEKLKRVLIGTKKFVGDEKNEQRIWWKGSGEEMKIDLVPYGGLESPKGQIAFPPDGDFAINTAGFAEAFANSPLLELTDDFTVRVVSLAGLTMLKFVAYNDRPQQRRRDVQDIWFIAKNYLKASNDDERLFDNNASDADLLLDEDFNYETCGARLLGRDIAPLLNKETAAIVTKILAEDSGDLQKFADVIYGDGLTDEDRYKNILELLRELRKGVVERLSD